MDMILARRMKRPVQVVEDHGREVVLVSVNKAADKVALIYREDYELLLALGVPPNWVTTPQSMSVCCTGKGARKLGVARILVDAGAGQRVVYLDGNPLNLKYDNLKLESHGMPFRRDRDFLVQAEKPDLKRKNL